MNTQQSVSFWEQFKSLVSLKIFHLTAKLRMSKEGYKTYKRKRMLFNKIKKSK